MNDVTALLSPHDVVSEVCRFRGERGREPRYLVMDGETYRTCFGIFGGPPDFNGVIHDSSYFEGVEVVVLPTDGIPMVRAVGEPHSEALRA